MKHHHLLSTLLATLLPTPLLALRIATSLQWIEHTPQPYAISHFYSSTNNTPATLISGGVANLATDQTIDLAANAETQGLKQYSGHRNIRLVYIICEVAYRIVATKSKRINTVADLRGKKIGTMPGTSAGYFIAKYLQHEGGLKESDYKVVSGNVCMKAPCGSGTLPAMLKSGEIDAFGIWEPAVELGAQLLGEDHVVLFQNASVYREVYSLYSTTEKLNDAKMRKDIVEFVKALDLTRGLFSAPTQSVYDFVAKTVGMDASIVKAVWADHKWSGTWGPELLDFLVEEDAYLAKADKRQGISKADLGKFLDDSVIKEL